MRVWALGLLAAALASACQGKTQASGMTRCDPLAAATGEVALASVVGAGQGEDGTVYVIDRYDGELRAFVARGGELYRQRVSGSGEDNSDGTLVTVSLGELEPPLTLQVVTDTEGTTRMGVVTGPLSSKTFTIGEQGEELSLMAASDAKALAIHDYPAEVLVEYAAELDDGRLLVVLRPRDFSDYLEFRVFLGLPQHLDERPVTNVRRARDGGSTTIDFEVDGQPSQAAFPVELVDDTFTPGAPSLSVGERELGLSLTTTESGPAGATYYCAE